MSLRKSPHQDLGRARGGGGVVSDDLADAGGRAFGDSEKTAGEEGNWNPVLSQRYWVVSWGLL